MQQPKIEVRVRDESRRDGACAKWSTVQGGERERESIKYFEGGEKTRWGEAVPRENTRK